jgi:REP element-mobilizing transposase RayT
MRKIPLVEGEHYHVYNRGVDRRRVFNSPNDALRFVQTFVLCNNADVKQQNIRDFFRNNPRLQTSNVCELERKLSDRSKLVNIQAYSLLENHFHFVLSPLVEGGLSLFMQRLQNGYTKYFNLKNERSGVLFQGSFRSAYLDSDEKFTKMVAYVSLNHLVHDAGKSSFTAKMNSWKEYSEKSPCLCDTSLIHEQFNSAHDVGEHFKETIEIIKAERAELEKDKEAEIYFDDPADIRCLQTAQ